MSSVSESLVQRLQTELGVSEVESRTRDFVMAHPGVCEAVIAGAVSGILQEEAGREALTACPAPVLNSLIRWRTLPNANSDMFRLLCDTSSAKQILDEYCKRPEAFHLLAGDPDLLQLATRCGLPSTNSPLTSLAITLHALTQKYGSDPNLEQHLEQGGDAEVEFWIRAILAEADLDWLRVLRVERGMNVDADAAAELGDIIAALQDVPLDELAAELVPGSKCKLADSITLARNAKSAALAAEADVETIRAAPASLRAVQAQLEEHIEEILVHRPDDRWQPLREVAEPLKLGQVSVAIANLKELREAATPGSLGGAVVSDVSPPCMLQVDALLLAAYESESESRRNMELVAARRELEQQADKCCADCWNQWPSVAQCDRDAIQQCLFTMIAQNETELGNLTNRLIEAGPILQQRGEFLYLDRVPSLAQLLLFPAQGLWRNEPDDDAAIALLCELSECTQDVTALLVSADALSRPLAVIEQIKGIFEGRDRRWAGMVRQAMCDHLITQFVAFGATASQLPEAWRPPQVNQESDLVAALDYLRMLDKTEPRYHGLHELTWKTLVELRLIGQPTPGSTS